MPSERNPHRESIADGLDVRLAHGLEHLRSGRYFEAHEELELAWRAAGSDERDFFQGLVHVAVAWYQAGRRRRVGAERQLAKAERRLAPYAPERRGVDVRSVLSQAAAARRHIADGGLDIDPLRI